MSRKIIIPDQDITLNPDKKHCFVCHLGLNHDDMESFKDSLAEGENSINETIMSLETKSEVVKHLYENYSRLELAMLVQLVIDTRQSSVINQKDVQKRVQKEVKKTKFDPLMDNLEQIKNLLKGGK